MTIKIERNVPFSGVRSKYPFRDMAVGDSFFVASENGEDHTTTQNRLSSAGRGHTKTDAGKGKKFATRVVNGGVRVWRVK